MRLLFLLLLLTLSTVSAQLIPSAPTTVPIIAAKNQTAKIANQYIIAFQFGLNESSQASVLNLITNPITSTGTLGGLGLNVPVGPLDTIVAGTILFNYTSAFFGFAAIIPDSLLPLVLQLTGAIQYIEEDATLNLFASTTIQETDTSMWNLDRIDQRSGTENGLYMYSGNGTGVNVYVIDTGIRSTHQEFQGRANNQGFNAVKDDKGTNDCQGHGTHVAGTVGGRTYGAAKGVELYAVRVLACDGSGSTSIVMAGVDWVTKNRKDPAIATMSLGGELSSSLDTSVKNSIATGIVYTVAAGNNNGDACQISPANVATAITVGAIDRDDNRASYSNWGTCVTLFAPGSAIRSASHTDDTSTRVLSGTSMATPLVAGVVAIYIETKKGLLSYTPKSVKEDLICSSTKDVVNDPQNSPNRVIYNFFTSPTSATSPPPSSISESCDNNSCETWTGTLSSQTIQFQPNGTSYKTTAGGNHRGWLDTTSGGGLLNPVQNNLILYQLQNDKWNVVASSSTRGGSQQLVYSASTGGDFAWGIQAKGATPTSYTLTIKRPTAAMTAAPSSSATTCTNNGNLNPDFDKNPGDTTSSSSSSSTATTNTGGNDNSSGTGQSRVPGTSTPAGGGGNTNSNNSSNSNGGNPSTSSSTTTPTPTGTAPGSSTGHTNVASSASFTSQIGLMIFSVFITICMWMSL